MSPLTSFGKPMRVALFGATGGVGSALLDLLAENEGVGAIYAGSRSSVIAARPEITPFQFDITREETIADAAACISEGGPLDLVLVTTGVLHEGSMQPEKTWRNFSADSFAHAFAVNATGPALVAKHMLPLLARDRKAVFAVLSARVGSIEDNRLGGWASYRASKAALHQIVRTCAIELARSRKQAICVALHPGTVDTDLSKPFQRGVTAEKLFTPAYSGERLLAVIDGLTPAQSGAAFAWDGARIPF
jgi:NAD(P)-dependent dehydrogenase (short-subunit alcohol dehydrogenase family)